MVTGKLGGAWVGRGVCMYGCMWYMMCGGGGKKCMNVTDGMLNMNGTTSVLIVFN